MCPAFIHWLMYILIFLAWNPNVSVNLWLIRLYKSFLVNIIKICVSFCCQNADSNLMKKLILIPQANHICATELINFSRKRWENEKIFALLFYAYTFTWMCKFKPSVALLIFESNLDFLEIENKLVLVFVSSKSSY